MFKGLISNVLILSLYGGLYYQLINPTGKYVEWVENYSNLYSIINTIVIFYLILAVIGMSMIKRAIEGKKDFTQKEKDAIGKIQQANILQSKLKKTIVHVKTFVYISFAIMAFVSLGYVYLPLSMMAGSFLTYLFLSSIKDVADAEIK